MAKNKGTFKTSANYQVKAAEPLDPRTQWDDIVSLLDKNNWPTDGNTIYSYDGLIATVGTELWQLVDKTKFDAILNKTQSIELGDSETEDDIRAEHIGWILIGGTNSQAATETDIDNMDTNVSNKVVNIKTLKYFRDKLMQKNPYSVEDGKAMVEINNSKTELVTKQYVDNRLSWLDTLD